MTKGAKNLIQSIRESHYSDVGKKTVQKTVKAVKAVKPEKTMKAEPTKKAAKAPKKKVVKAPKLKAVKKEPAAGIAGKLGFNAGSYKMEIIGGAVLPGIALAPGEKIVIAKMTPTRD